MARRRSPAAENLVRHTARELSGCLAMGYVDVVEQRWVALHEEESVPSTEHLRQAAGDLFRGNRVAPINGVFEQAPGAQGPAPRELLMVFDSLVHVLQRSPDDPDRVLVAVFRSSANLGVALIKTRAALEALTASEA
ncbi:MAG: hypothetical protein CMN30_33350 [Sandaracinus sp.]|nr:hypothetical protein [Sandaracinus sp.]MAR56606.1 hypothetical protein [Rickettsiales bacterium]